MPRKSKAKPATNVKVVMIDPFIGALLPLELDPEKPSQLRRWLECANPRPLRFSHGLFLWIDPDCLLRQPFIYPRFIIRDPAHPLAGFCIASGPVVAGKLTPCPFIPSQLAPLIRFEDWPQRIDPMLCLEQTFRLYPVIHDR